MLGRRLAVLGAGAFVVATDGTLVVGLLRQIARGVGVSPLGAGQALTVFAVAYAVIAPIAIRVLRARSRKHLLVVILLLFALTNVGTGAATSLAMLLAVRAVAGICAGVFFATAGVVASKSAGAGRSGRALATVVAGGSIAAAFGVPLGTFLGGSIGWRPIFFGVGALSAVIALVLAGVVPATSASPAAGTHPRWRPRNTLPVLATTLLWATGSFAFFTYLGPILHRSLSVSATNLAGFLFAYGVAGIGGAVAGGWLTDRRNPVLAVGLALVVVTLALAGLAILVGAGDRDSQAGVVAAVAIYGFGTWAVNPPQQQRLLASDADPHLLLSLNASVTYAGVALGSGIGGALLGTGSTASLCWASAGLEVAALCLLLVRRPLRSDADHVRTVRRRKQRRLRQTHER